ncbi:prepilin-type N-terminal cleavage/methylation domain-containing protein [Patescibacteria group bacterium]|nr:MAG: prepilin-type N-terminal cleavage/methylation domain-containing protein [Patescibacteria group bacterium]
MKQSHKGFTLIELLVVIAIIGLLSTLAVVALNSAREKSRDAKRVSDVKQIQTALELYYSDNQQYPDAAAGSVIGTAAGLTRLDGDGFGAAATEPVYMGLMPRDPQSPTINYTYTRNSVTSYTLGFSLEGPTGQYTDTSGDGNITCTATQDGIACT